MKHKLKRIINNKSFMTNLLRCTKKKNQNSIIQKASKEEIFSICECVLNILRGNLKLKPKDKLKLQKYKSILRKLINIATPVKHKKKLIQTGGFIQTLLPIILTALSIFLK